MAIPEDSIPITLRKVGNTTFLEYVHTQEGVDFKIASTIKRTLIVYKNGVKILPEENEVEINNFYIDMSKLATSFGATTPNEFLQKLAENKMFQ